MRNGLKPQLRKYLIMGSQDCHREPEKVLQEAIDAGITVFQYREKGPGSLTGHEKIELGKRLRNICKLHDILFIVNDDIDLIEPLQVDGIHVGQEDTAVEDIGKQFPQIYIGLSVSTIEEVEKSPIELVDYLGAGPIYETPTKPGQKPSGLKWLKDIKELYPNLPIVAIGGIHPHNAQTVMEAGADGLAVISAITKSEEIQQAVARL